LISNETKFFLNYCLISYVGPCTKVLYIQGQYQGNDWRYKVIMFIMIYIKRNNHAKGDYYSFVPNQLEVTFRDFYCNL